MKWNQNKTIKKRLSIGISVLFGLLLLLNLTNPSLDRGYRAYENNTAHSFLSRIVDAVPFGINKSFCKADFYLFSVFTMKYSSFGKEAIVPVSYGVLGMVFSLDAHTASMNPLEMLDKFYQANKWLKGRINECEKL